LREAILVLKEKITYMRLIVGISGASGSLLGYHLLKALREFSEVEVQLIVTEGAMETLKWETDLKLEDFTALADVVYDNRDLAASIASGSYHTDGMIIVPCSMKTVAGIVDGFADNLLLRAADVCLKEERKLVLVPREMPLSCIHLRNLKEAADYGCSIVPPMLTFYNGADSLERQMDHIVGKVLARFGLEYGRFVPWQGDGGK
jgi:4-hydroxy-3-polyprenylbenzoate decarboxylase